MTEFLLYFEVNIICIIVLAIIGINIKVSEYSPGRRPRIMLRLIVSTIGFYLLDILGGYVRMDKPDPNPTVVFVLSALYFLLFALSAYHWFFYSEILHNKAFFDRPRRQLLTFLPIAGLLVLLVVSYFNGCLFSVTEKDGYARGPFFAVQALLSLAYLVAAWLRCSYFARRVPRTSVRRDLVAFRRFSLLLIVCACLQFPFGRLPLMIIGTTVSILLLYLHYLRNMISLDPLTEVPNRRKLLYQTAEIKKDLHPNEALYFLFVDVDDFKTINDNCGHAEGDRVLSEISHILRKFCKEHDCLCGRFGGDEFAVVQTFSKNRQFHAPEQLYDLFATKHLTTVDGSPVTVSIGCACYTPGETVDDLVAHADQNMYAVKQAKKATPSGGDTHPLFSRKNN